MKRNAYTIKDALLHSMCGIRFLIEERAFRQNIILGIILLIFETLRHTSPAMRMYLFTSYCIVLIMECFNTAIEATIDRISLEKHELSKKAKDLGSATVFLSLLHLGIAWILSWFF